MDSRIEIGIFTCLFEKFKCHDLNDPFLKGIGASYKSCTRYYALCIIHYSLFIRLQMVEVVLLVKLFSSKMSTQVGIPVNQSTYPSTLTPHTGILVNQFTYP